MGSVACLRWAIPNFICWLPKWLQILKPNRSCIGLSVLTTERKMVSAMHSIKQQTFQNTQVVCYGEVKKKKKTHTHIYLIPPRETAEFQVVWNKNLWWGWTLVDPWTLQLYRAKMTVIPDEKINCLCFWFIAPSFLFSSVENNLTR